MDWNPINEFCVARGIRKTKRSSKTLETLYAKQMQNPSSQSSRRIFSGTQAFHSDSLSVSGKDGEYIRQTMLVCEIEAKQPNVWLNKIYA